uniref:Uncharacterized protein n=1 Tax=Oryza glumipatula TaxID=40148 RepID=A0A0D9ZBE4_9ORYZ
MDKFHGEEEQCEGSAGNCDMPNEDRTPQERVSARGHRKKGGNGERNSDKSTYLPLSPPPHHLTLPTQLRPLALLLEHLLAPVPWSKGEG